MSVSPASAFASASIASDKPAGASASSAENPVGSSLVCAASVEEPVASPVPSSADSAVVFFDVDGTLIWHKPGASPAELLAGEPLSPQVKDAFRRLRERGHVPVLCTGRPTRIIPAEVLALEPAAVIADAGAHVRVGDEVIYDVCLSYEDTVAIAEKFYREGLSVMFEGNDGEMTLVPGDSFQFDDRDGVVVHSLEEFAERARGFHFAKLIFYYEGGDNSMLERVRPFFDERFRVFDVGVGIGEGALTGIDKGAAIAKVLERFGHGVGRTFGIGDSENDLSMFAAVETSIAMGNALPHVKEAADYVTLPVEQDGVAHALEHFGLI